MKSYQEKLLILASMLFLLFGASCGDSSSPSRINPAQGNSLPEESENIDDSSGSVNAVESVHIVSSESRGDALQQTGMSSSNENPWSSAGAFEENPTYAIESGTLIDDRDGKIYKTVKIGEQVWMAENLNYETDSSYCYNDSASYCVKYGRLYTWYAAQKACPSGFHLPNYADWNILIEMGGGEAKAGKILKSRDAMSKNGYGADSFGFSALLVGYWNGEGYDNERSCFWGANEYIDRTAVGNLNDQADNICMRSKTDLAKMTVDYKNLGYSVRCIQDDARFLSQTEFLEPVVDFLIDSRDGLIYKTVTIGSQTWMAENLRHQYDVSGESYGNTYCVNYRELEIYGRYYTWAAAMDSAAIYSEKGKGCGYKEPCSPTYPVRGICPEGWHLPDTTEWQILYESIEKNPYAMQRQAQFKNWENATNESGFSALPAGGAVVDFYDFGTRAYFWSSRHQRSNKENAYYWVLSADDAHLDSWGTGNNPNNKKSKFSVRCLKD